MSEVSESILLSTKKKNNVPADYTAFDDDFISYINAALSELNQHGIGPAEGLAIEDESTLWTDFYEDPRLNAVQTFVGLRVRLLFDPPATSFAINMMEEQLKEMGWRLVTAQEDIEKEQEAV
jgi:hypothetical protein